MAKKKLYAFDLDDNILILPSRIYLYHKKTGEQVSLLTSEYIHYQDQISKEGKFKDYKLNYNEEDSTNYSYREFRDFSDGERSPFISDIQKILDSKRSAEVFGGKLSWKGASWERFYKSVVNQDPISIVTSRGNDPENIKAGLKLLVEKGYLPCEPNYVDIYPVHHPEVKRALSGGDTSVSTAELKFKAVINFLDLVFHKYGDYEHSLGISDDSPHNIAFFKANAQKLKEQYPRCQFSLFPVDSLQRQFTEISL